jgi:hypothetical protein
LRILSSFFHWHRFTEEQILIASSFLEQDGVLIRRRGRLRTIGMMVGIVLVVFMVLPK